MNNHIHLLGTPSSARSLPACMQSVGRRYAQYFNRCYDRSGALWEGRYKSMLVDSDSYLLTCYRYIELNPVRAGIARKVEDYPYSSYACNALGKPDEMVTAHELFTRFISGGRDAYVELFGNVLSSKELAEIRRATVSGLGVGKADFLLRVEKLAQGSDSNAPGQQGSDSNAPGQQGSDSNARSGGSAQQGSDSNARNGG